jgi:excisionase family DNA binding protein
MKVSRRTVYRWLESGELPATQVGRSWRISQQDIERKKGAE